VTGPDARLTAETVWRMESATVVAVASRVLGDVGLGEEIAQDAFVAALEQWPSRGVPPNPAGWLVSTARHQAIDLVRRRSTYARKLAEVGRCAIGDHVAPGDLFARLDDRSLVDIGVLVRARVLGELVDVDADIAGDGLVVVHAHHHALRVDVVDHAAA